MKYSLQLCLLVFLCILSSGAYAQCEPKLKRTTSAGIDVLSTTDKFDGYRWVRCPDYTDIPGANSQSYAVVSSGSYAAIVMKGTCTDTSDCMNVMPTAISLHSAEKQVLVFPNPSSGHVNIKAPLTWQGAAVWVYSLTGQQQLAFTLDARELSFRLTPGWHYVSITKDGLREVHPVLVAE
jgi:predicted ester cyclase